MNVLIVRAHHEPKSFSSALADQAAKTLGGIGHKIVVSDLYAEKFDPVSDRRNFTTVKDPAYLKQQVEEAYASEVHGFAPNLEAEIKKLEAADLLIFSFPIWWFGMPGILKSWVDRVFVSGRIYGGPQIYETGLGKSKKRGLILMTTGGGPDVYGGYGVNPPMTTLLAPIQHGVFWFNGFLPLDPFIAWSPVRVSPEVRAEYLEQLDQRLRSLDNEQPQILPPLSDFPGWGKDIKKRFMVTASNAKAPDEAYAKLVQEEIEHVAEFKRQGLILSSYIGNPATPPWHAFLVFRESSDEAVRAHLQTLPLASYLNFEVTELMQM
jgi:NAD(P)H dehydrogenase (quinone)